jgi:dihydroorotase-like cyclic amidohydrolase
MQILLKGGRLIDPTSGRDEECDFHVVDGRIERIGKNLSAPAAQVVDLRGKVVAPGFIDLHVHLREPKPSRAVSPQPQPEDSPPSAACRIPILPSMTSR